MLASFGNKVNVHVDAQYRQGTFHGDPALEFLYI